MCIPGITPDSFNPSVLYIVKRKFSAGISTPYHSHDFFSLMYILSGACTYKIEDHLYSLKKGDIILCNSGVMHGKVAVEEEGVTEIHIGLNNIYIDKLSNNCLIDPAAVPVMTPTQYELDIFRCFSEILLEQEKNEPGRELMLKAMVMKLLVIVLKSLHRSETGSAENGFVFESYDKNLIVNTIVSYINDNYMNEISLNKISKNMYLSPVYISRIFKEEVGDSPINYLIKVRLSKAKEMLAQGNIPVKEAARCVGYHDAYHFSKLFKKHYGTPPSMYKG